jgi:hypothetical protein
MSVAVAAGKENVEVYATCVSQASQGWSEAVCYMPVGMPIAASPVDTSSAVVAIQFYWP